MRLFLFVNNVLRLGAKDEMKPIPDQWLFTCVVTYRDHFMASRLEFMISRSTRA